MCVGRFVEGLLLGWGVLGSSVLGALFAWPGASLKEKLVVILSGNQYIVLWFSFAGSLEVFLLLFGMHSVWTNL